MSLKKRNRQLEQYLLTEASQMLRPGETAIRACSCGIYDWVAMPCGRGVEMAEWLGPVRFVVSTERLLFIALGDNAESEAAGTPEFGIVNFIELADVRGARAVGTSVLICGRDGGHLWLHELAFARAGAISEAINSTPGTDSKVSIPAYHPQPGRGRPARVLVRATAVPPSEAPASPHRAGKVSTAHDDRPSSPAPRRVSPVVPAAAEPRWEDPDEASIVLSPIAGNTRYVNQYRHVAAALVDSPGRWALLREFQKANKSEVTMHARQIERGKFAGLTAGRFETRITKESIGAPAAFVGANYKLYVRYVG